jgi:EAL domain-containing protein (putative c-di-GMP-specific phosphodiesterase class I)
LRALLHDSGIAADALELELTESTLLPTSGAQLAALAQCRLAGIRLCLDDFGTGHATLGALHQLPVDRLKIDRSFIQGLPADLTGQAIVRAAIALSRELQLDVVAEGVETSGQLDFLRRNACQAYQGHLGAPALPAREFERLWHAAVPGVPSHALS